MVVAIAPLTIPSACVTVLGHARIERQSPLYVAVPVQEVNNVLGRLHGFVSEVVSNPEGVHQLKVPVSLIEDAREEMRSYTEKASEKLESLRNALQAELNANPSLGLVEVVSHVKESASWVEKVVGRLLLEEGDEKSQYLKDMFRIGVIVKDDAKVERVHDLVCSFLLTWKVPLDLPNSNCDRLRLSCLNFLSEPKRNLGEDLDAPQSPWRGIKGSVGIGDIVFEYQVKSKWFSQQEKDPNNPACHWLYEKLRTEKIAKLAIRLGLDRDNEPAIFIPFLKRLVHNLLVDPAVEPNPPSNITIARTSD